MLASKWLASPRGTSVCSKSNALKGIMKDSTKDRMQGHAREAKGKVKETTGRITKNRKLEDEGTAEKVAGKVQKKVGDIEKVFED